MRGGVQRSSGSTCYHPLFVFNLFDDLERCILRPGKVYSADSWRDVLEPVVDRYRERGLRRCFQGEAALHCRGSTSFWKTRTASTWESPTAPDARIAKMKDGPTRLAYKPEHTVDLDNCCAPRTP